MIPLGTDRPNRRPTLVTYVLIVVNLAVFVGEVALARLDPDLAARVRETLWLHRGHSGPWTYAAYAFLHGGVMHIVFNMLFLWVFGPNVEDRFGRIGFTAFYLVGGAAAGLGHTLFSAAPVVGASGAIAAVTGAFLVLFPRTHVRLFMFFIIIGMFSVPSWWFIAFAIIRDFIPFAANVQNGTAFSAHLGGYVFGVSVSLILLATKLLPREQYDLFSIAKHRHRRRKFKEAGLIAESQTSRIAADRKRSEAEEQAASAIADARAAVTERVARSELDEAAEKYRDLLDNHGHNRAATTLNRAHQLTLANHLYRTGDQQVAAIAYDRFLESNPGDAEAPGVRLLLGLINARFLNDPIRAKVLLNEAVGRLRTPEEEQLAQQLIEELG